MASSINDQIVVTSSNVVKPPCLAFKLTSSGAILQNPACLQSSLLPFQFTSNWPNGISLPQGISLDDIVNAIDVNFIGQERQESISLLNEIYNAMIFAQSDIHHRGNSLYLFQNQDCSSQFGIINRVSGIKRVLSCHVERQASQSIYVTPGFATRQIQPFGVGCTFYPLAFCPISSSGNVQYKFWTYYPTLLPPNSITKNKENKIELYLWPGLHDKECGKNVTLLQKRTCNMDENGATCFTISGDKIGEIIETAFGIVPPIFPINVGVRWKFPTANSYTAVSAWQTWIAVNGVLFSGDIANCSQV